MVLVSTITDIAIVAFQNVIIVLLNHTELTWKLYKKMGGEVELYHLWLYRLEGCCMNVFAYIIPIFYTITAFGVLLGCNMKNQAVSQYIASIGWIFLYHYLTELVIEVALFILERYHETDVLKRVIFMRSFKDRKTRIVYTVSATAFSVMANISFLRFT